MAKRRANGEGNIRKRKDGRWEGRYTAGHDAYGKAVTKNVLGKTQAEVKEKLKTAIAESELLDVQRSESYTTEEWLKEWYKVYCRPNLRDTTARYYEMFLKKHIFGVVVSNVADAENVTENSITVSVELSRICCCEVVENELSLDCTTTCCIESNVESLVGPVHYVHVDYTCCRVGWLSVVEYYWLVLIEDRHCLFCLCFGCSCCSWSFFFLST